MQSDWPRAFWPISQEQYQDFFSQKASSAKYNFIWASNAMLVFGKKLKNQFQENARVEGLMERWSDSIF